MGQEGYLRHLWQPRAESELAVAASSPRQQVAALGAAGQHHGVVQTARRLHVPATICYTSSLKNIIRVRDRRPAVFVADQVLDYCGHARALAVSAHVALIVAESGCDRKACTYWCPSCPSSPLPHVITYLPSSLMATLW
jgi:hypothetical protein